MAVNYPASLDNGTSLPYPSATDDTNSPSLAGAIDNLNDAVIALEDKLGIADANSQTPVTGNLLASTATGESSWSVPYPASTIVGISDTQTLTNKTIDIANNTITNLAGADIASQSITAAQIANNTITATQVANNTITATQIANNTITATQIANNTITNTQIASGGIDYANLLSTIFSGQSTSYTNPGSAGGTFSYVNLGGIKLFYGTTGALANSSGVNQYTITFPSSFFNSVIGQVAFISSLTVNQAQQCSGQAGNITSYMYVNVFNGASGATANLGVIVVGT